MEAVLDLLTRRAVVVALALAGAALATAGTLARSRAAKPRWAEALVYAGYGLTGASILLFIVAGFRA